MKVLVFCVLVASAAAWPSFGFQADHPPLDEGVTNAHKQHDVNFLLWKIYEPLHDEHLKQLEANFDPQGPNTHYDDAGVAVKLLVQEVADHHLLAQKHWFSLFNDRHRAEALMLYDVLEHSTDWNTFVGNAAYFRHHVNEGVFVYALYAAVVHSALTTHVVLPPLYEVTPHMFTNAEVIEEAYTAKMTQKVKNIEFKFTGSKKNPEQRVAYFGEDIGMNTHHVMWHLEFPFWWNDEHEGYHLDRKGENFFWVHHQLTVRFDAERLSNYLDPVEELHWEDSIHEGFAPHTMYKYGGHFPSRPDDISFSDVHGVANIRDMIMLEHRIRDAIAHGYVTAENGDKTDIRNDHGIDILGDIIESSVYSLNPGYYGALHNTAHIMLGRQGDPQGKFDLPPGVLEHFETSTRDPAFFRLHKYMDNIFREHRDSLPCYTQEELEFNGVNIENFHVKGNLQTYFEDFSYSLINAVDDTADIPDVDISTHIPRLNHKDFSFVLDVDNEQDHDVLAAVRIFAWAHQDNNGVEVSFDDGRWNAIEVDKFWIHLHPGHNHIEHRSADSSVTVPDVPSFKFLMDRAEKALEDGVELHLEHYESSLGIPNRFLVPKGNCRGLEFDLVVAVTDGTADAAVDDLHTNTKFNHYGYRGVYPDKRPHGYPLDRHVEDERIFENLHNFKHIRVKVYHS